jgi:hypothetical protein
VRRLGRANKPLETRNRWIGETTTLSESSNWARSQPRSCLYQTPLVEAANARIREIRLLD